MVIKTLDQGLDPDSLEMLDPDQQRACRYHGYLISEEPLDVCVGSLNQRVEGTAVPLVALATGQPCGQNFNAYI